VAVSVFHLVIRVTNGKISVPTHYRVAHVPSPSVFQSSENRTFSFFAFSGVLFVLVAEMCELSELRELSPHDVVGSLCVKGRVAKKSLSHEDDQDDQTALRCEYLSALARFLGGVERLRGFLW
jgi:hypothetical protein